MAHRRSQVRERGGHVRELRLPQARGSLGAGHQPRRLGRQIFGHARVAPASSSSKPRARWHAERQRNHFPKVAYPTVNTVAAQPGCQPAAPAPLPRGTRVSGYLRSLLVWLGRQFSSQRSTPSVAKIDSTVAPGVLPERLFDVSVRRHGEPELAVFRGAEPAAQAVGQRIQIRAEVASVAVDRTADLGEEVRFGSHVGPVDPIRLHMPPIRQNDS